jgi:TRAP transporter TAXI family solute receptor
VQEWAAVKPWKTFFPEPLQNAADFRTLGYQSKAANYFVTLDPDIKTPKDFVGKRLGIGLKTQNEWGMHPTMMLEAWGLKDELASLSNLGTGPNIQALLDNRTDVGFLFMPYREGVPVITPPQQELEASGRDFYFVQVPPEMVEEVNQKTGSPFNAITLPKGFMPGQDEDLHTFGDWITISCHKSFPDELAYEFVKFWIENGDKLAKLHTWGKLASKDIVGACVAAEPDRVHSGAMKYYKEIGMA